MWSKMLTRFLFTSQLLFLLTLTPASSEAAELTKGRENYLMYCADCHGTTGISVMPDAPSFAKNESLIKSDTDLLDSVNNGKNAMPLYRGILSDQEILDILFFIRTLN